MNYRRQRREIPAIDITPLIDVVFQLIIFLVVTTTFTASPGIKVDLPRSKSLDYVDKREQLTVLIRADGVLMMDGQPVSKEALGQAIGARGKEDPSATLILNGDTSANLGLVVEVMDLSKRKGISRIHIGALPEGGATTSGLPGSTPPVDPSDGGSP